MGKTHLAVLIGVKAGVSLGLRRLITFIGSSGCEDDGNGGFGDAAVIQMVVTSGAAVIGGANNRGLSLQKRRRLRPLSDRDCLEIEEQLLEVEAEAGYAINIADEEINLAGLWMTLAAAGIKFGTCSFQFHGTLRLGGGKKVAKAAKEIIDELHEKARKLKEDSMRHEWKKYTNMHIQLNKRWGK
uniref:Uncharacterized protein n=1 Tax=Tanacetum cinerariifolium TaxID=118510 RepID=A0A6L2LNU6_TANCI|nr:hypothetical protein [Tanacetum cinerariifolium]